MHALRSLADGHASLEDLIDLQWFLDPPDTVSLSDMPVDTHSDLTPRKMLLERIVEKVRKELYDNSEIHRQSFIARLENALDSSDQQILDMPPVTRKRGRPVGAENKGHSIRREKSHFEYVEGNKCRVCGQTVHNARTCRQKNNLADNLQE